MKTAPLLAAAGLLAVLGAPLHASSAYITVSATALPTYTQAKFPAGGSPAAESYVFYQGAFSPGQGHDKAMEGTPFRTIALALAQNMAASNFQPTRDASQARLLIAVEWGVTEVQDDPMRDFYIRDLQNDLTSYNGRMAQATGAGGQPVSASVTPSNKGFVTSFPHLEPASTLNMDLAVAAASTHAEAESAAYNAHLLGFAQAIAKSQHELQNFTNDHDQATQLLDLLTEPRYFIVLQAYDYHQMAKNGRPVPLWTSRVSVEAGSHSFTAVLPDLCRLAAQYAGRPTGEVKTDTVAVDR